MHFIGTETGFQRVSESFRDAYPILKCPIPDSRTESERIVTSSNMTFLDREIWRIRRLSPLDFSHSFFPDFTAMLWTRLTLDKDPRMMRSTEISWNNITKHQIKKGLRETNRRLAHKHLVGWFCLDWRRNQTFDLLVQILRLMSTNWMWFYPSPVSPSFCFGETYQCRQLPDDSVRIRCTKCRENSALNSL